MHAERHDHRDDLRPDPDEWRYALVTIVAWTLVLLAAALL